jgi:hypothetical protein
MRQLGALGQVLWKEGDLFLLCIELVHAEKCLSPPMFTSTKEQATERSQADLRPTAFMRLQKRFLLEAGQISSAYKSGMSRSILLF